MIILNDEIKQWIKKFEEKFDDIVPIRQISGLTTNKQIIDAIEKSIKENQNLLPTIFNYKDSNDKTF
jgi:hypothetical protein